MKHASLVMLAKQSTFDVAQSESVATPVLNT